MEKKELTYKQIDKRLGLLIKKVKTLSKELFKGEVERISKNYIKYSSWFK